ncbi:MAG: ExbD/TolR family protein [Phormidesmis sp.]
MKLDLDNRQSDVQIEILPMIDVIFCILTFFILAAVGLTRQQAINLDLPSVNNSTPVQGNSRDRLYVSVDSAGQVYVDKSAVPLGLLYDVLVQHQQIAPNGTIVLYASRSARYEDVVKVLDLLRSVGGDRVALATLPNDASLDPTQGNNQTLEDVLREQGVPISPGQSGLNNGQNGGINISPVPSSGRLSSPGGLPPVAPPAAPSNAAPN